MAYDNNTIKSELPHCPCCTGKASLRHRIREDVKGKHPMYFAVCGKCGLSTSESKAKITAVRRWSRRA